MKNEEIAYSDFVDGSIPGEGIGFANVANYGIEAFVAFGVAKVFDVVIGVVEHGSN